MKVKINRGIIFMFLCNNKPEESAALQYILFKGVFQYKDGPVDVSPLIFDN